MRNKNVGGKSRFINDFIVSKNRCFCSRMFTSQTVEADLRKVSQHWRLNGTCSQYLQVRLCAPNRAASAKPQINPQPPAQPTQPLNPQLACISLCWTRIHRCRGHPWVGWGAPAFSLSKTKNFDKLTSKISSSLRMIS